MPSQMQRFEAILNRLPDKERGQLLEGCIALVRGFFSEWCKSHITPQVQNQPEDPDCAQRRPDLC